MWQMPSARSSLQAFCQLGREHFTAESSSQRGALLLGRRVLETNGKKITRYQTGEGILLSSTGAGLVIVSSIFEICPFHLRKSPPRLLSGLEWQKAGLTFFTNMLWKNAESMGGLTFLITQPIVFACEPFLKRRLLLYLYHDECTACLTWCAESDESSQKWKRLYSWTGRRDLIINPTINI